MAPEPDAQLRRLRRRAAIVLVLIAAAGLATGGVEALAGAVGGGLLVAVSAGAIRGAVDALMPAGLGETAISGSPNKAWSLVKFITRFAILALVAYVMMVRLRAQPVWMLLGASSFVAAAALEAVRVLRGRP